MARDGMDRDGMARHGMGATGVLTDEALGRCESLVVRAWVRSVQRDMPAGMPSLDAEHGRRWREALADIEKMQEEIREVYSGALRRLVTAILADDITTEKHA